LVELGPAAVAFRIVPGVGHVFLGVPDRLIERGPVQILKIDGGRSENRQPGRRDLSEAAPHEETAASRAGADLEKPGPKRGEERSMPWQHSEVALRAGNDDLPHLLREEQALRGD
jgi:hypothetical protein